jgi:hypothetical protein
MKVITKTGRVIQLFEIEEITELFGSLEMQMKSAEPTSSARRSHKQSHIHQKKEPGSTIWIAA